MLRNCSIDSSIKEKQSLRGELTTLNAKCFVHVIGSAGPSRVHGQKTCRPCAAPVVQSCFSYIGTTGSSFADHEDSSCQACRNSGCIRCLLFDIGGHSQGLQWLHQQIFERLDFYLLAFPCLTSFPDRQGNALL